MSIFRFKQFEVNQEGCAMKINTDGVLLAALAHHAHPQSILDVGTGTGVMALMLAQRFQEATVDAVEIDQQAATAASENFARSPFAPRLRAWRSDIASFETPERYDLMVTNPPFFLNDLRNEENRKGLARHTDIRFFEGLLAKVDELLKPEGQFWFILPLKQAAMLIEKGRDRGLYPAQNISIHSDASKPAFRQVVAFMRRHSGTTDEKEFHIYEREKVYTEAYKNLLMDFFLGY